MIYKIISYSRTGNNSSLANELAEKLSSEHIIINDIKKRNYLTIGLDMLFNRVPKVNKSIEKSSEKDVIIIISPVWMGMIAAPMRRILIDLKRLKNKYVFITVSGGVDGFNLKLEMELLKRCGREPIYKKEFCISNLIQEKTENIRDDILNYKLTKENVSMFCNEIIENL